MRLVQRDGTVTGTYRRSPDARAGFFLGTLTGKAAEGSWHSELGSGGARLRLVDEGSRFRGTWSQTLGKFAGTGQWNGLCVPALSVPR